MNKVLVGFVFCVYANSILAEPPNKDCVNQLAASPSDCCKLPKIFDDNTKQNCVSQFGGDNTRPGPGCCVAECLLNATGILVNGQIDKNGVTSFLINAVAGDSAWQTPVQNAIAACEMEEKEMLSRGDPPLPQSDSSTKRCHPRSGMIIGCFMKNLFMNCPNYSTESKCVTLKTQIPTCPFGLMSPK